MPDGSNAVDLSQRVWQATQLAATAQDLEPHLDWVIDELLQRVGPDDLAADEKMSIVVILAGAHARKRSTLPRGNDGRILDIVRRLVEEPAVVSPLRLVPN